MGRKHLSIRSDVWERIQEFFTQHEEVLKGLRIYNPTGLIELAVLDWMAFFDEYVERFGQTPRLLSILTINAIARMEKSTKSKEEDTYQ
ncbi:hypothetical protein CW710_01220 [Candidatus Bathyarchaeota archaeon]|nr:hypothetical protein [Candidatus Bathyarchaeota archaeon]RJS74641.1 MAG: hypothetical protein CW710_01220 [Candidatus Bathyarchaeota archaeon]